MEQCSRQHEETFDLYYQCRSPWQWVFKEAFQELIDTRTNNSTHNEIFLSGRVKRCEEVSNARLLPSKNNITKQNKTRRFGCTLRIELASSINSDIFFCYYGTSQAMEGLADKDEFVRTLSNFNCEYLSPPSLLIDWDVSESYCLAIKIPTTCHDNNVAVLKTPLGSRGEGVFFISCGEEIVHYVQQNYIRAMEEKGNFLQDVYQSKGRYPSWILQAEIYPPMLIEGHKFHLRTYVVILERPDTTNNINIAEALDVYIYTKHEVRIASVPFSHQAKEKTNTTSGTCIRNRQAHITNGASSDNTKRCLLHNVKELAHLSKPLEFFIAKAFGCDLLPNMTIQMNKDNCDIAAAKFAFSGVDVMIDEQGRFYILEVNVNPAAPPKEVVDAMFHQHLVDLCKDLILIRLVVTNDINITTNPLITTTGNDWCSTSDATIYNFALASNILKNNLHKYKN